MAAKLAPKYPRRETVIKKRLLSQAVLLLLAVGGALFYAFIHNTPPEEDALTALDRLAAVVSGEADGRGPEPPLPEGRDAAGLRAGPRASPAAPQTASQAGTGATRDREAAPAMSAAPATSAMPGAAQGPSADSEGAGASGAAPGMAGAAEDRAAHVAPFAGKSLEEAAAELTRRHGGKTPALWNERMPGITSTLPGLGDAPRRGATLALTLDACGGKKGASYDAAIIEYLRKEKIPATIFVTSGWMKTNAEALADLTADPLFEIAAHGLRHRPASVNGRSVFGIHGTASIADLVREVEENVRGIEKAAGKRPRWFRAGTAYYDDVAVAVIADLGLGVAGFSIACDEGATLPAAGVKSKILTARHGDILLLHLNKPRSGTREGLLQALPVLRERGARFVRLSDIPEVP